MTTADQASPQRGCIARRRFLLLGGGTAVSVVSLGMFAGCKKAEEPKPRLQEPAIAPSEPVVAPQPKEEEKIQAVVASYPRKKIASLKDLKEGVPIEFKYPSEDPLLSASFLVKLGAEAGAGVGSDKDIVAFNGLCPHMGGPLMGNYRHEYKAVGPCPFHLSSFDLRRHGMIVVGHATESLPQIVLEVEGDDIWATGVMGLIFGTVDSKQA